MAAPCRKSIEPRYLTAPSPGAGSYQRSCALRVSTKNLDAEKRRPRLSDQPQKTTSDASVSCVVVVTAPPPLPGELRSISEMPDERVASPVEGATRPVATGGGRSYPTFSSARTAASTPACSNSASAAALAPNAASKPESPPPKSASNEAAKWASAAGSGGGEGGRAAASAGAASGEKTASKAASPSPPPPPPPKLASPTDATAGAAAGSSAAGGAASESSRRSGRGASKPESDAPFAAGASPNACIADAPPKASVKGASANPSVVVCASVKAASSPSEGWLTSPPTCSSPTSFHETPSSNEEPRRISESEVDSQPPLSQVAGMPPPAGHSAAGASAGTPSAERLSGPPAAASLPPLVAASLPSGAKASDPKSAEEPKRSASAVEGAKASSSLPICISIAEEKLDCGGGGPAPPASPFPQVRNWTFTVGAKSVEGWVSGPKHQLDINIHAAGDAAARTLPHGIVGQSFSATTPREGKRDAYPGSNAGRFKTSAMAEGAIEGNAAMYEVTTPYETRFAFSRFDEEEVHPNQELLGVGDGDASATEAAEEE
mmetsp:Transcript_35125/g.113276  ORF Transcript_35125/g.113276 Transcript_35125/m.113276 type:complete len:549 (-) Transcript_35125:155-1801(-)